MVNVARPSAGGSSGSGSTYQRRSSARSRRMRRRRKRLEERLSRFEDSSSDSDDTGGRETRQTERDSDLKLDDGGGGSNGDSGGRTTRQEERESDLRVEDGGGGGGGGRTADVSSSDRPRQQRLQERLDERVGRFEGVSGDTGGRDVRRRERESDFRSTEGRRQPYTTEPLDTSRRGDTPEPITREEAVKRGPRARRDDSGDTGIDIIGGTRDYLREQRRRAKTGVSPLLGLAVGKDEVEQLARGERKIFEAAERGDWPSRVFVGGEIIQNVGRDVNESIRDVSPLDRVPVVGRPTENVAGTIAEGPFLIGGGIAQFASVQRTPAGPTPTPEEVTEETGSGLVQGTVETGQFAKDRPLEAAGLLLAPYAIRGTTRAVRHRRSGSSTGETIPYKDITTERGTRGEIPKFETRPGEPTSKAVAETRQRATDQPNLIQETAGNEGVLYHTTGERLGREVTVGEGSSELPGMYTSPDANPVGLRSTPFESQTGYFSGLRPTLPRLSTDRVAAVEVSRGDIKGMPKSARGAGYEVRRPSGEVVERGLGRGEAKSRVEGTDLEVRPDSSTEGYRFLTEEAEPGSAQVRPSKQRSTELEAILPPETQLTKTSPGASPNVRIGGRSLPLPGGRTIEFGGEKIPLDFFRRSEVAKAGTGKSSAKTGETTVGEVTTEYTPTSEILPPRARGTPAEAYSAGIGVTGSASSSGGAGGSGQAELVSPLIDGTTSTVGGASSSSEVPAPATTSPTLPLYEPPSTGPIISDTPSGPPPSTSPTNPPPSTAPPSVESVPDVTRGPPTSATDTGGTSRGPDTTTPPPPPTSETPPPPPTSERPPPPPPSETLLPPPPTSKIPPPPPPSKTPPPPPPTSKIPPPPPPSKTPPPPPPPTGGLLEPWRGADKDRRGNEFIESEYETDEFPLAPGWLSETVADIATGGFRSAPVTRAQLESADLSRQAPGELPTAEFFDEETAEDIGEVQDLFGLGNEKDETGFDDLAIGVDVDFGFDADGEDQKGWSLWG